MPPVGARARVILPAALVLLSVLLSTACGRLLKKDYEYEEELYLALDGSATLNVNASVASLAALRGMDLPVEPEARVDREQVRALFSAPGVTPTVSLSRRDGRRFVHVSIDVDDVRNLTTLPPFAWSTYRFERRDDVFDYRQMVGPPRHREVGDVGWTGQELVAFRMHVPSKIPFHNAPSKTVERGNILEWEQPLTERLQGTPVDIEVQMQSSSILSQTLLLFGGTVLAAALTMGAIIWWVIRRAGRGADAAQT